MLLDSLIPPSEELVNSKVQSIIYADMAPPTTKNVVVICDSVRELIAVIEGLQRRGFSVADTGYDPKARFKHLYLRNTREDIVHNGCLKISDLAVRAEPELAQILQQVIKRDPYKIPDEFQEDWNLLGVAD